MNSKYKTLGMIGFVLVLFVVIFLTGKDEKVAPAPQVKVITSDGKNHLTPEQALGVLQLAIKESNLKIAIAEIEVVAGDETLPDDVRGVAFVMLGDICVVANRPDLALLAYQQVGKLKDAGAQDKADALESIKKLHSQPGNPKLRLPKGNSVSI